MNREPAVIVSAIAGFLTAVFGLAVAFGADLSDAQQKAILGVVAPTVALFFLIGPIIRQFVTPTEKAKKKIDQAFAQDPNDPTAQKPTL